MTQISAPWTGFALEAKCAITRFSIGKNKVVAHQRARRWPTQHQGQHGAGIEHFHPRPSQMVSIRIDEAMAVLKEAADAANDVAAGRKEGKADG